MPLLSVRSPPLYTPMVQGPALATVARAQSRPSSRAVDRKTREDLFATLLPMKKHTSLSDSKTSLSIRQKRRRFEDFKALLGPIKYH